MKKQLSFIAPLLIMVLLGIVLLFLFLSGGGPGARKDPLYTDLTASPVYAKIGFQPEYAQITNPRSVAWDLVRPPQSGPIIMSDLPRPAGYARYGQFSPAKQEVRDFTILLPFTLEAKQLDHSNGISPTYPILYFASIGENWEVFVNGHSVARQIFLDKTGAISEFRNVRGVSIPVEKEYLREGSNVLVIHILGAYSSKWTGLRYESPYYLSNSPSTFSNFTGISNMLLCAIFMCIGLFHLLTYAFRKTDRYNLLFVGFTVVASLYFFLETQALYAILPNTEYGQRLDYALMYLLVFLGVAFLETINSGKITRVTTAFGIFGAALAVGQWFFPIWFAYGLVSVWRYTTIFYAAYAIIFDVLWQIYKSAVTLNESKTPRLGLWQGICCYLFKTEFGSIYIMLMIVGLTVIIDIVNIAVFNLNFPLKDYSLLGFTMGMAFILARKHSAGYEMTVLKSFVSQDQELARSELTTDEMNVAMQLIEGESRRDIARKLHLSATTVSQSIDAIREKVINKSDADPVVAFASQHYRLTRREVDVMRCLRRSMTNSEIAAELFLSEETVKSHLHNLMKKLPVKTRQDIATWTAEDKDTE